VGGARLPPGELVAVKFIDVISDTDAENPQNSMTGMTEGQILNEISILKKLNSSEYVVKLVFCTQAHFRVILGLELMPHGSLLYNLEETKIWRGKQVSEVPSAGRSTVPSATLPPDVSESCLQTTAYILPKCCHPY
jgi:serine/threonine protein kinase